jgi:hypothetical protein
MVMKEAISPRWRQQLGHRDIATTMIYAHLTQDHIKSQMNKLDGVAVPAICPKSARNPLKVKKGNPAKTGFPLKFAMVPLKLFFAGYPRERISSGSGVPKGGFDPPRVSPPPPQAALPLIKHSNPFTYQTVIAVSG